MKYSLSTPPSKTGQAFSELSKKNVLLMRRIGKTKILTRIIILEGCSNDEADHLNCASLIYIFVVGKDRNNLPSKLSSGNIYCTTKLPSDVLMSDHLNRSNSFCLINWTHLIFYVRSTGRSNTTYLSDHLDRSNSFCPITWTDLIVSVWSTGPVEYSICDHLDRSNTFWPINWTDVIFSVWSTGPVEYSLPDLLDRWYNFCPIN